jgi:hypothetical protein
LQPLASLLDVVGSSARWRAADATLRELMSCFALAPDALKQQLRNEHAALTEQHQQQVQQLRAQQQQCSSSSRPGGSLARDEHLLFVWLRQQILSQAASAPSTAGAAGGRLSTVRHTTAPGAAGARAARTNAGSSTARGCTKAAVVDQLLTRMPGKSRQQLETH